LTEIKPQSRLHQGRSIPAVVERTTQISVQALVHRCPSLESVKFYLDTNAVSNLFRPSGPLTSDALTSARGLLVRSSSAGTTTILISAALLDELSGISATDPSLHGEISEFLWSVGGANLLRSTMDLARLEVGLGRVLTGREPFDSREVRRELRRAYGHRSYLAERTAEVGRQTELFKREEEERRESIRQTVAASPQIKRSLAHESRDWWSGAKERINDWIRESWAAEPQSYGLAPDPGSWPDPAAVPTVWGMFAYKMARMHLNIGERRRVDGSDFYDAHHYVAASYADILVTDDSAFGLTCDLIPTTPFRRVGFREYVDRWLVESSRPDR